MTDIIDVDSNEENALSIKDVINLKNISEKGYESLVQYNSQILGQLDSMAIDVLIQEIDEENLKTLKSSRTDIRKELKAIEDQRKDIEKLYNRDLKKWKDFYTEYAYKPLDKADKKIKTAIDAFEDKLREDKTKKFIAIFEDKRTELDLDFVKYEDLNLNVQLSTSESKLEEEVYEFFEKITNELKIIELGDNTERVLAEYYKTLDLSRAYVNVNESIKSEEMIARRIEERKEEAKNNATVQNKGSHEESTTNTPINTSEYTELITARIIVSGTRQQLAKLQEFMKLNKIQYK